VEFCKVIFPPSHQILPPFTPNPSTFHTKSFHLSHQILPPFTPNPSTFRVDFSLILNNLMVRAILKILQILKTTTTREKVVVALFNLKKFG